MLIKRTYKIRLSATQAIIKTGKILGMAPVNSYQLARNLNLVCAADCYL
ncbi:hypothetical protein KEF85_06175 [Methylomonas paludis]|uniref:Uncharacterized protein n=1 Tax=Methylomonas paludis TaxID=1173101 RepID=A0A975MR92_9GAMM|nr:hypothetical protein [Methylomonas paludis]QWF72039.1 hypothetical protein KEF85_06175 [Methylomonas paludis]